MLRVFAIAAVLAAFGGALYLSGDYLQAWEAPQPPANAAPAPPAKQKAKAKRPARQAKRLAGREGEAAWLTELNAFCIRSLDEMDAIEPPASPEEVPRYLRRTERTSNRMNRQMIELVQRSGDATTTTRALRRLFRQEKELFQSLLTAAQNGDVQGLRRVIRSALALAKAENRLLTKLGSVDCTLEPDAFDLPY